CDSGKGTTMAFPALLTKSRDVHSDGHGLGLAIVHDIVQLHKGRIRCEKSQLGGASFVIELPVTDV
ncbi:ATP-binding protein, partial [Shewanella sp. C31]|nr:ATP-binding protein [Shewanella electrica]